MEKLRNYSSEAFLWNKITYKACRCFVLRETNDIREK